MFKLMHKIQGRDLIRILDAYKRSPVDNEEFVKKIIHLVPFYIFDYDHNQFATILDIIASLNIANKEFYEKYIFPKIESYIEKFSFGQYTGLLRNLIEIGSFEDEVFWSDYILPKMFSFPYNYRMARNINDILEEIKEKLPMIDVEKETLVFGNMMEAFREEMAGGQAEKVIVYITKDYGLYLKRVEKSTASMGGKKKVYRIESNKI